MCEVNLFFGDMDELFWARRHEQRTTGGREGHHCGYVGMKKERNERGSGCPLDLPRVMSKQNDCETKNGDDDVEPHQNEFLWILAARSPPQKL